MSSGVTIRKLPSGVPGLDEVLGGGIPELSFTLIAGGPGCGKTTLGHQIVFANATPERKALYFTIMGEPPIKMLRYQQQYTFFDAAKVGDAIGFVHLGQQAVEGGLASVLDAILGELDRSNPAIVVVDSFRSAVRNAVDEPNGGRALRDFIQRLALQLTARQATTFLIGEYGDDELGDSSIFTVADGIVSITQAVDRNSVVRKLQVVKMRGQGQIPGLHTARITSHGFSVFPRLLKPAEGSPGAPPAERLSTGAPDLDAMMGGGIPRGHSILVAGPSGSGKTLLTNQFVVEGGRVGESAIVAVFEKRPEEGCDPRKRPRTRPGNALASS